LGGDLCASPSLPLSFWRAGDGDQLQPAVNISQVGATDRGSAEVAAAMTTMKMNPGGTTMSTKTRMIAGMLTVLTAGAFVSLGTGQSQAYVRCTMSGGHPLCLNVPEPNHRVPHKCYFLPTVSNGSVSGLREVCS
jgi:hypothetical protein